MTELDRLLRAGDATGIADLTSALTEPERNAWADPVATWCELLDLNQRSYYSEKARRQLVELEQLADVYELFPAAHAAALACCTFAQIRTLEAVLAPAEACVRILGHRRPAWADDFAKLLCEGNPVRGMAGRWPTIRALVKAGICHPPTHDNYVLGALEGIWPPFNLHEQMRRKSSGEPPLEEPALEDLLLAERDWLDSAFWRLFEIDGTGEVSLANCSKYGRSSRGRVHDTWTDAMLELSRRCVLSRERLLDASLEALSRDFIQFRAGWFSRFHQALEPTAAERATRLRSYLDLLGSSIPPTVTMAIEAVSAVDMAAPQPAGTLLPALAPALTARTKSVIKSACALLGRIAEREAKARTDVCLAAVPALLHGAADVQKDVFLLLENHGDTNNPALRAAVADAADAVAASLRKRLEPWIGPRVSTVSTPPVAPAQGPCSAARLAASRALPPITSFDDLVHAAASVLETPDEPDEIECVLDGLCRLGGTRPDDFARRTSPLLKRALRFRSRDGTTWTPDRSAALLVAMLLSSWIERRNAFTENRCDAFQDQEPFSFLFRRAAALARQLCEAPGLPMLSAPTHRGGWIEPAVLVDRWSQWQASGRTPDIHEQVVALLRMAPERRSDALTAARTLEDESGEAVRHALGASTPIGTNAALWVAASRSRQPHGDVPDLEKAHPDLGPDAGRAARPTWMAQAIRRTSGGHSWSVLNLAVAIDPAYSGKPAGALLPVVLHAPPPPYDHPPRALVQWLASLWPANREALFARAALPLSQAVFWSDVDDRETAGYLVVLGEPSVELRPMACLALALGLAATGAALRSLAQEALISMIADARCDAEALGTTMMRLLDTGFGRLSRWAKSLKEVASASPQHPAIVASLLRHALRGDPTQAPREIGTLLELLFELQCQLDEPLTDPATRSYLQNLKPGGKSARLVKNLLRK